MKIVSINGNPKTGGFIGGCLDVLANRLEGQGASVVRIVLADQRIEDCKGCFVCLKTGNCPCGDDVDGIVRHMIEADGFVVGSPVRNGTITALYKRFYERITYRLRFTLLLEGKQTLAISSVGMASGKAVNRRFLSLGEAGARCSDYLFFRIGMPAKITAENVRPRLEQAADRLLRDIETKPPRDLLARLSATVDRTVVRRYMFSRNPEFYASVIEHWKRKGYI